MMHLKNFGIAVEKGINMNYIDAQLFRAIPYPLTGDKNGIIRLKVQTEHGATNWLNVTPYQMQQIETILNQGETHANN